MRRIPSAPCPARLLLLICWATLLFPAQARPAEVIILGDSTLKPVMEVLSGLRATLPAAFTVYAPPEITGRLPEIVTREGARTVIALGNDALREALVLPSRIAVLYALVVLPPESVRPNTTGLYMGTPVSEYLQLIARHLPALKTIAMIGSPRTCGILGGAAQARVSSQPVNNSFEFIDRVKQLSPGDALLLLPDAGLLTATALEETYLFSFRAKVPILGLSEKHVRQGALLALVFDPVRVGRVLGETAAKSLSGEDVGRIPPSPSSPFDLYVNRETARKMGIPIPDEMLNTARAVFP